MVGILVSFWDGLFSGAMLVSGRVFKSSLLITSPQHFLPTKTNPHQLEGPKSFPGFPKSGCAPIDCVNIGLEAVEAMTFYGSTCCVWKPQPRKLWEVYEWYINATNSLIIHIYIHIYVCIYVRFICYHLLPEPEFKVYQHTWFQGIGDDIYIYNIHMYSYLSWVDFCIVYTYTLLLFNLLVQVGNLDIWGCIWQPFHGQFYSLTWHPWPSKNKSYVVSTPFSIHSVVILFLVQKSQTTTPGMFKTKCK